jgi:hypothetical protein
VQFLPDNTAHKVQILLLDGNGNVVQPSAPQQQQQDMFGAAPGPTDWFLYRLKYTFPTREERQKFQQAIRGAAVMKSFRALSVQTNLKSGKKLSRDISVKVWLFPDAGATRPQATLTFARNVDNNVHEEIDLRCFGEYSMKDITKDSKTVTLRVRRAGDVSPSGEPVQGTGSRRPSLFSLGRRSTRSNLHDEHGNATSESRRSSMNSVFSVEGGGGVPDLPNTLRNLEYLRIEFSSSSGVRHDFCTFFNDAWKMVPCATATPGGGNQRASDGLAVSMSNVGRPLSLTLPDSNGTQGGYTSRRQSPVMQAMQPPQIGRQVGTGSPGLSTSPSSFSRIPSPRLVPRSQTWAQQQLELAVGLGLGLGGEHSPPSVQILAYPVGVSDGPEEGVDSGQTIPWATVEEEEGWR